MTITSSVTYFLFVVDERPGLRSQVFDQAGKHSFSPLATLQTEGHARAFTLITVTAGCGKYECIFKKVIQLDKASSSPFE